MSAHVDVSLQAHALRPTLRRHEGGIIVKYRLVLASLAMAGAAVALAAGPASASSSSKTNTLHFHTKSSHVSPNLTIECTAAVPAPFQIVKGAGRPWYAESYVSSCSTPPPDSCAMQVDLEEFEPTEYGGWEWQNVQSAPQKSVAPCSTKLRTETSGYTCLSTLTDNEFRTFQIFTGVYESVPETSSSASDEISIPCE